MSLSTQDYVSIANLLGRYCIAYDQSDADAMATIFRRTGFWKIPKLGSPVQLRFVRWPRLATVL
jgi:hypothetical protein